MLILPFVQVAIDPVAALENSWAISSLYQTLGLTSPSSLIYVIGFFYPVVPKNEARIRVQISAAMSKKHIDQAIEAFEKVGKELNVILKKPVESVAEGQFAAIYWFEPNSGERLIVCSGVVN